MVVSHKRGKRTSTHFQKIAHHDLYDLWQAETQYLRPHQIRIHAAESGLKMVGETLYSQTAPPQPLLPKKRPLYSGISLHLKEVLWAEEVVTAPLPKKMLALINRPSRP